MTKPAWPLVHEHDDGIRAAGRPDACFYCGRHVGQHHRRDCVIITKLIELQVTAKLPDGRSFIGAWQLEMPFSWSARENEDHKNKSSWCKSNLLRDHNRLSVMWDSADAWKALETLYESGDCLCGGATLTFAFVRVIDATPCRKLRLPTMESN